MTVVGIVGLYNNLKSTFFLLKKLYEPSSDRAVYSNTSAREAAICRPPPDTVYCGVVTWRNERDGVPFVGKSCN
jgi:hypothetical protein